MEETVLQERTYIAIDLKSFYASVECVDRNLNPLTTHLVVADPSRTQKTICLAVSPSLKTYGIPGRVRLFEVVQKVNEINAIRKSNAPGNRFTGHSANSNDLASDNSLELEYITAPPRMSRYIEVSSFIYNIYLKYVSADDIHVYSIDEVFIDITEYMKIYGLSAHDLTRKIIKDVLAATKITATAGIGTNLYLAKVAMDIMAKKMTPDADGVRIAELDEYKYRKELWNHTPLTDFWRVGRGYSKKLLANGLYTMGDIARCSLGKDNEYYNEDLLYKLFGINAELLIDHAWGWEPCTIKEIKAYKPESNSISSGQVLHCGYDYKKARIVIREMADSLALDLVSKKLVTNQLVLDIGYDIENISSESNNYTGPLKQDYYGRLAPKNAHGSINLSNDTSSSEIVLNAVSELYDQIVDTKLIIRRFNLTANHVHSETDLVNNNPQEYRQLDLFTDYNLENQKQQNELQKREKERNLQNAILSIRDKYGKNAILRGFDLEDGATTIERNNQIGGHKA